MIVCSCRNISDRGYSPSELKERLKEDDYVCGICLRQPRELEESPLIPEKGNNEKGEINV